MGGGRRVLGGEMGEESERAGEYYVSLCQLGTVAWGVMGKGGSRGGKGFIRVFFEEGIG